MEEGGNINLKKKKLGQQFLYNLKQWESPGSIRFAAANSYPVVRKLLEQRRKIISFQAQNRRASIQNAS